MQEKFSKYYKIISDNIKNVRKETKLSQEKFAETVGCSREYISRIENYHEVAGLDFILNIATTYNKEPDSFLRK